MGRQRGFLKVLRRQPDQAGLLSQSNVVDVRLAAVSIKHMHWISIYMKELLFQEG